MIDKLNRFKSLDDIEEIIPGTLNDLFTDIFKKFLLSEGFKYEISPSYLSHEMNLPEWTEDDDKSWTKHCGTEDHSWYNTIFIRYNRIEVCSEIECGGIFTNKNYWEYDSEESFQEAYNNSVKWLKEIKECQ